MSSFEKRIIDAILSRIRVRREAPSHVYQEGHHQDRAAIAPSILREATFSDFEAVRELKRRWGLIPDSFQNWERLWRDNPALKSSSHTLPIGWVLQADCRVVGYLGNVASLYHYGARKLTAVTGHGFVVEPAHRAVSLSLMAAFFRQKSVDLYLTTTAIPAVGKIAQAFKAHPLPQPDYEQVLFWVLKAHPFAQHVMERLRLRPTLSSAGAVVVSVAIGTDKSLRRRWPRHHSTLLEVKEIGVASVGDDFRALWTSKITEKLLLLADRTPATLRWHFETPGDEGTTRVFCCYAGKELRGYAVVRNDPGHAGGLRRSFISDILAKKDDSETLSALCVAAYNHAKHAGSHTLEVLGFPQSVRSVCSQWSPFVRKYPSCPFYYKAADPDLHKALADAALWYASPFDGDTTLMPLLATNRVQPNVVQNAE
jgi:hypothetical protein